MSVLVGTYTEGTGSEGIYFIDETGAVSCVGADTRNPSYLELHPGLDLVYAVSERRDSGAVQALSRGEILVKIGEQPCLGEDPCHLAISKTGRFLLVSNYTSGTFASFPLDEAGRPSDFLSLVQHTGKSVDPVRQTSPHVHSIWFGPDERFIYVVDLGIDAIVRYPVAPTGAVDTVRRKVTRMKPGAGPRHLCFDSHHEFCYVVNELDSTLTSFALDTDGGLTEISTFSTLAPDCDEPNYPAEIVLSGDDRYLYVSNRGVDSLGVFAVCGDGRLKQVQQIPSGGRHPRHFALTEDEAGIMVANRDTNNVTVFDRDADSGVLTQTGEDYAIPAPACIRIL